MFISPNHLSSRSVEKYKCHTPAASEHPSRPSSESTKEEMKGKISEAPSTHKDAKAQALLRGQCVVTGTLHLDAPEDVILASGDETPMGSVECAHIIPEAIFFNVETKEDANKKACHVLYFFASY
ncbi:hypothetical protein Agabi119p4_5654 [Agaricus bisporus var. burnettii]|uniref:HNH nuclease domain-containing protein n=1 Tax=Agaricus bisporus var. burnettii TaxID=192524 RepID=A0A8H7KGL8_AGABI|nr:hypothetical protein Agabi119p4_5654 [Agaricus bisporus var. burnettii]